MLSDRASRNALQHVTELPYGSVTLPLRKVSALTPGVETFWLMRSPRWNGRKAVPFCGREQSHGHCKRQVHSLSD